MGGSVTIRVRDIILVLVVALVALAAYLVGSAHADAASAAGVSVGGLARTVTMTGKGELTAVPDQLTFHLSVVQTRDDVSTAMDASSATLQRVLAALAKQGVGRKDTQSTGLSIDPVYRYFNYQPPQITGYHVRQSLTVVVRDLRNGGKAVADAIDAGGNAVRVSGIKLRVGDTDALLAKARDAAVASATDKAKQYAAATGQELGDVLTLQEGHRAAKPRPLYQAMDSAALAGAMREPKALPIRAGRQDVSVTVSIVWQLA
jgi:uncharacterized protein YggE